MQRIFLLLLIGRGRPRALTLLGLAQHLFDVLAPLQRAHSDRVTWPVGQPPH